MTENPVLADITEKELLHAIFEEVRLLRRFMMFMMFFLPAALLVAVVVAAAITR